MKRIDTTSRAIDLFGLGKDGFQNGNLGLGQPATEFNADWPNGVQEELLSVIEAAGIAPSGGALNQLLLALRATGVFLTPARFDNGTKVATTAFVRAAGHEFSTQSAINATGAIAAALAGSLIVLGGGAPITATLPAANAVPAGATFTFISNAAGQTVARAGGDLIFPNSASVTAIVLNNGDTLQLVSNGVNSWSVIDGSVQLPYSNAFASSLSTNGYQRLPSGLILQWGSFATTGTVNVTFPIAFPNAAVHAVASNRSTGGADVNTTTAALSTSGASFTVSGQATGGNGIVYWLAIGY